MAVLAGMFKLAVPDIFDSYEIVSEADLRAAVGKLECKESEG
jgi:hypothetical protein